VILGGVLLLAGVLALLVVTKGDLVERDGQATTYLVTGRAIVPQGLAQDDVVVLSGTVTIEGTVEDDVLVVNGRALIDGTVHGDVTVLRGRARLGADAVVGGDVRSSAPPRVADGATVDGDVGSVTALEGVGELPRSLWFALWLMAGLSVLAVGLLVPRHAADTARAGAGRPARSFVLGGALLAAAPVVIGVLSASLVGLGVALVLGAGLVLAVTTGAAGAGMAVGRLIGLPRGPLALLAGWAALGVGLAVALVASPVLAAVVGAAIAAFGVGALVPPGLGVGRADDHDQQDDDGTHDDDKPDEHDEPVEPVIVDDEPTILAAFPIGAGTSRN
jgi:hypothetical protein